MQSMISFFSMRLRSSTRKAKTDQIPRVMNPFLQTLFLLLKFVSKVSFLLLMALKNFVFVALEVFVALVPSSKTPTTKEIMK